MIHTYIQKKTIIHYLYCILKNNENYAYMAATTVQQPWLQRFNMI